MPGRLGRVVPRYDNPATVWIEKYLCRIKPESFRRRGRSVHAVGIDLSGPGTGDRNMPVVVRAIRHGIESEDARWRSVVDMIEEQQRVRTSRSRKQAKIDSFIQHCGPDGRALPWFR